MTSNQRPVDRSGPLRRLPSAAFVSADLFLEAATVMAIPDDQTQRKAFESLMPHLYVLRNRGCSWAQLTKLLKEAGLEYQLSTVRNYYGEMLATRQDICQQRMNEQILLMAEVRKETKGVDVATLSSRVAAIMEKQRAQVASKLDSVFGSVAGPVLPDVAPAPLPTPLVAVDPPAVTSSVENFKTGLHPAPQHHIKPVATGLDDALPVAPVLKPMVQRKTGLYQDETFSVYLPLRCSVLPEGVIPLKRREGIDEAMYLPGDLEHPYLPGVMLSLEQRLSSIALEFVNTEDGEVRMETPDEKRFRVKWKKPIPMTISSSSHEFTKMDYSLFL